MTRKIFLPIILLLSIIVFYNYYANPPDGYTGAPVANELSCTVCHFFDTKDLKGYAEIVGLPTKITPGDTYPISVKINNTDKRGVRTSFQLVSLLKEMNAGEFLNPGSYVHFSTYKDRTYAESHPGIKLNNGKAEFTFSWKAPTNPDNAIISFYATGLIADGDNTYVNDKVKHTSAFGVLGNSLNVICVEQINNECINDSIGFAKMDATGGKEPYSFEWSNGLKTREISNLKAGIYYVTVTDDDQIKGIGYIKITEPEILEITEILKKEYSADTNGSIEISVSGGTGDYQYQWSWDNVFLSNEKDIFDLLPGCYDLMIADSCENKIDTTICILDISKTESEIKNQFVNIYPVPANNFITIESKMTQFSKCEILDLSGRVFVSKPLFNKKETLNISQLDSGVYILRLSNLKEIYLKRIFVL